MIEDDIYAGPDPGPGWTSLGRGVHVRTERADHLPTRLRAWQLVLPFWSSVSALTAAELRGWWLPPMPRPLPLFVASGDSDRIDRRGLHVCRHDVLEPWELLEGVRTASAAETVLTCARELGLLDVILIGDSALHFGDVTRADLVLTSRLRRRGSPLLREAIPFMDGRAESIYESLLRVLHVVCGIEVEPQHQVVGSDGSTVARGDLVLVGTTMLHEVDGSHHLGRLQQRSDLRRHRRILAAGYERRGFTPHDVVHAPAGILRDADTTLGREFDASRLDAWYSLLRESCFTSAGRRRLQLRLGLAAENAEQSAG